MREEVIEPNHAPRVPLLSNDPDPVVLWAQIPDAFDTLHLAAERRLILVLQSCDVQRGDRA